MVEKLFLTVVFNSQWSHITTLLSASECKFLMTFFTRLGSIQMFRLVIIIGISWNDEWLKLHHISICLSPICFKIPELFKSY